MRVKRQGHVMEITLHKTHKGTNDGRKELCVVCVGLRVTAFKGAIVHARRPQRLLVHWVSEVPQSTTVLHVPLVKKSTTLFFHLVSASLKTVPFQRIR